MASADVARAWEARKTAVLERVPLQAVVERVVRLRRSGAAMQGLCPFHEESTPSFAVYPRGGTKVRVPFWKCYGCGAGGDVIGFVMRDQALGFREAVELLEREGGLRHLELAPAPRPAARRAVDVDREKLEASSTVLRQALAIAPGDPVDVYLRRRFLVPPAAYGIGDVERNAGWPDDLRHHPQCWHEFERRRFPAMVAAIRSHDGSLLTVHRTYLELRDGVWRKAAIEKPKLVVGAFGPGFIRLGPDADRMLGGEGIETTLSAMQLWKRPGICFVNSGRMKSVEPPFACSDFIYAADKGGKGRWGEKFALAGAQAFGEGRRVVVRIPAIAADKGDFNDLLAERARAPERRSEAA